MVTVRPAEVSDADRIAEIHVRTWQAAYAGAMPADVLDGLTAASFAERDRRAIERRTPPIEVFVAEADGGPDGDPVVVGFCMVGPYGLVQGQPDERAGEVYAIYAAPEHWSTGAGFALMRAGVDHLAAHGRTEVRLWVLADNPRARRFYERFGFVADGGARTETVGDGGPAPAVIEEVRYTLSRR
ncbi:MAG TPA: GNAT family N-acetyltransferase [Micromonosporaceae bacterium]|nr:GNAT family N-acetyltransferase [Micromonosporaceae bacterium]